MTLEELGALAGLHKSTLSNYEKGRLQRPPGQDMVVVLEAALDVHAQSLQRAAGYQPVQAPSGDPVEAIARPAIPFDPVQGDESTVSVDDRLDVVLRELQSIREQMGREAGQTDEDREKNASG